jgi:hypothetical protein
MRYFYYTNQLTKISTAIIVDELSEEVSFFPTEGRNGFSTLIESWINYYERRCAAERKFMFEICENQFKKFVERGIVPENWDWR